MKKTKIICSIGPSSRNYETMKKMIDAGMNVARINFSHADEIEKIETVELVTKINEDHGTNVAILYDTKGPDFRTGVVENDGIVLEEGKLIKIVKEDVVGNSERITVNYKDAIDQINVGNIVLLEDGLMRLEVVEKDSEGVLCKIVAGGVLGSRKGVNVPGVSLNVPFISEQDREDIIYACQNKGDFLALSFVNSKEDILAAKKILEEQGRLDMQIISKVESTEAIKNIDEIVDYSDGVMVARGDLGVEIPVQELPILQKMIVEKCRKKGKFCIVATEMLTSMQKNARPTRAEVSDIANAVLDGADAVMLSGETTVGKYPVEAVTYMAATCETTEKHLDYNKDFELEVLPNITSAIAKSVIESARVLDVKVIATPTKSGYTARTISNLRPKSFILALCPDKKTSLSLALNWGVYPVIAPQYISSDEIVENSIAKAKEFMNLQSKDIIIVTGGFPVDSTAKTNFLKIEEIK